MDPTRNIPPPLHSFQNATRNSNQSRKNPGEGNALSRLISPRGERSSNAPRLGGQRGNPQIPQIVHQGDEIPHTAAQATDTTDENSEVRTESLTYSTDSSQDSVRSPRLRLLELPEYVPSEGQRKRDRFAGSKVLRDNNASIHKKPEFARINLAKFLRKNLPPETTLDDNGNLGGTAHLLRTPTTRQGEAVQFKGMEGLDFQDYFNQVSTTALDGECVNCADQSIVKQAQSDLYRLDFEFVNTNGESFRSQDLPFGRDQVNERNEAIIAGLQEFSGSKAATTVLSAMLVQTVPAAISRGLTNSDGKAMSHLRMISAMNTVGRQVFIVGNDGSRQPIAEAQGLGGARFKLTHHNDDFLLSIEWQAYYEAKPGYEDILPLRKNEVIGVNFKVEFLIDGEAAHRVLTDDDGKQHNQMRLVIPNGIRATFSGQLNMN